jgi:hypothetical protein
MKEIYFDVARRRNLNIEDAQCVIDMELLFYFGSLGTDILGQDFKIIVVLSELIFG